MGAQTAHACSFSRSFSCPAPGLLVGDGPDFHWWKGATYAGVMTSTGVSLLLLGRYLHAKRKGTQRV